MKVARVIQAKPIPNAGIVKLARETLRHDSLPLSRFSRSAIAVMQASACLLARANAPQQPLMLVGCSHDGLDAPKSTEDLLMLAEDSRTSGSAAFSRRRVAVSKPLQSGGRLWLLAIRGPGAAPFDRHAITAAEEICALAADWIATHDKLARAASLWDAALEGLDCIDVGIVIADSDLRPLTLNAAAREIAGCWTGEQPREAREIWPMIRHIDATTPWNDCTSVAMPHLSIGGLRLAGVGLSVGRLRLARKPESAGRTSPSTIYFLFSPVRMHHGYSEHLCAIYGLTHQEARIVLLISEGLHPKDIARREHASINTVRYYLKRIFTKTGTTGQLDLLRLVLLHGLGFFRPEVVHADGLEPRRTIHS